MAFVFVPNAEGGFDEGDKQTNPDTGVEYIYVDGAWRALGPKIEDEFGTLDQRYLKLSGGTLTSSLKVRRGSEKTTDQLKIAPNGGSDYATSIYSLNNGQMRLRSSHTPSEGDHVGSHIILDPNGGVPETKIYHLVTPTRDDHAANKEYVDTKVASTGVPVGSIMIWLQSTPPDGWFKCQGRTFDINEYPLLHAYLQTTAGYTSGRLPDWSGRYPGEYGDHLSGTLGTFANAKTAKPSGGSPKSSGNFNNGGINTANKAGGTDFASTRSAKVEISEGWDSTTRPKTVVVHYIIKHD